MAIRIDQKIVKYQVVKDQTETAATPPAAQPVVVQMHEKVERPEVLMGCTYKVKTPLSDHALYITINDIILNPGTPYEVRRPFEIFINSKAMEHFQWIVALTRIISAVFRKGGDSTFLIEELHSVFDPRGGYFKKGGKYMPSLVAEIGDVIKAHMRTIGMLPDEGLDEHQRRLLDQARTQYEAGVKAAESTGSQTFPESATLCPKCHTKAMILMDNCLTCLNCGNSKCG
jgi:hypothetical protein